MTSAPDDAALDTARSLVRQVDATQDLIDGLNVQRHALAMQLRREASLRWKIIGELAGVTEVTVIGWSKRPGVGPLTRRRGADSTDHPAVEQLREVVAQLATLQTIAAGLRDRRRVALVALHETGWSMPEIGREFGVSFEAAAKWMGRRDNNRRTA